LILIYYNLIKLNFNMGVFKIMSEIKLGQRIRQCRKNRKLSLDKLSQQVGISLHALLFIEQGKQNPRYDNVIKLKKALPELTFDELI